MRGYDAWKLATPYDDECPECQNFGVVDYGDGDEPCRKCEEARDYADGLADYLYEKRRDERGLM